MRVQRQNVPEFLIPPFGPNGGGQLLNYDIIEFPEEENTKSSSHPEFSSMKKVGGAEWSAHSKGANSTNEG